MSLGDLVRELVGVAHDLTKSEGLQTTVQHYVGSVPDGAGTITYSAPVTEDAFVRFKHREKITTPGKVIVSRAEILYLKQVPVKLTDKYLLPDGTLGYVVDIDGAEDQLPYVTRVYIGERGSR